MHVVIADPARGNVEAWATKRLPFEPTGWQAELRDELRDAISQLRGPAGSVLHAAYGSADQARCDVENVTTYNVGLGAFDAAARSGICIERRLTAPDGPIPHAGHHWGYRIGARRGDLAFWHRGDVLAHWLQADWPALRSSTTIEPTWWRLRSQPITTAGDAGEAGWLALRLQVGVPEGVDVAVVRILKALVDGALAALHVHDGTDAEIVAARVAAKVGVSAEEAREALADRRHAVLGERRLLWPFRDGVQWNPADDRLAAIELYGERVTGPAWTIAGELCRAEPEG